MELNNTYIPEEILRHILTYLVFPSYARTCTIFNEISKDIHNIRQQEGLSYKSIPTGNSDMDRYILIHDREYQDYISRHFTSLSICTIISTDKICKLALFITFSRSTYRMYPIEKYLDTSPSAKDIYFLLRTIPRSRTDIRSKLLLYLQKKD